MKIAFLMGRFPTISETFILNQITGMIDRGHDVCIYAESVGDLSNLHGDVLKYNLIELTHYFGKAPKNYFHRFVRAIPLFIKDFLKAPVRTILSLNFLIYGRQALSLRLLYTLTPDLREEYDIIHCQFGGNGFRGIAFRAMHSPKAKLVTTFRGYDISGYVKSEGSNVYESLFQCGDLFLTNCEFFKQRLYKLGCPIEKLKVHGSGLDCSRFPFRTRHFPEDGLVKVVTVGRFIEKKGIEYGIKAIARVLKKYPKLNYFIIGDGKLRKDLEDLVKSLGIVDSVTFLGKQPQEDIISLLETSHIFIAPCVTASDGDQDAPINTLKEAMAMGMPVISTLHGGIPELVEDNVSGYLVPERDADAIAQKLIDLINHPEIWPSMGQAGHAFVEKHYNLNHLNDELAKAYNSLLSHT